MSPVPIHTITSRRGPVVTSFDYNDFGDLTKATDSRGITRTLTYDANGNNTGVSETFGSGPTAVVVSMSDTFDAQDRHTVASKVVTQNGTSTTVWSTSRQFNAPGVVVSETDPNNNVTEHVYDIRGLEIETRRQTKDENNNRYPKQGSVGSHESRSATGREPWLQSRGFCRLGVRFG